MCNVRKRVGAKECVKMKRGVLRWIRRMKKKEEETIEKKIKRKWEKVGPDEDYD